MMEVLKFGEATGSGVRQERRPDLKIVRSEQPNEEPDVFWLEVSRGLWVNQPVSVNPANAPGRVLTEMFLILGGAGLLALLATVFFGSPSS